MAANRADHQRGGEYGAKPNGARNEEEQGGAEFRDAAGVSSPRLKPDFCENVNRLFRSGEFKVERLEENYRCHDSANPAYSQQRRRMRLHCGGWKNTAHEAV